VQARCVPRTGALEPAKVFLYIIWTFTSSEDRHVTRECLLHRLVQALGG